MNRTLRAYLELSRVSNVPTVLSNALAGAACAAFLQPLQINVPPVVAACAASIAFYVAGMALNDFFDREIDAKERPHRPIPSGRALAHGAAMFAIALIVLGLALLTFVSLQALVAGLALVACIIVYDLMHAATAWSVLIMGTCRGLVYVVGALAIGIPEEPVFVLAPALILLLYVAGFSIVARREAINFANTPRFACGSCGYPSLIDHGRCSECGHAFTANDPTSVVALEAVPQPQMRLLLLMPLFLLSPICLFGMTRAAGRMKDPYDIAIFLGTMCTAALIAACTTSAIRLVAQRPPRIGSAVALWIATISVYDAYLMFLAHMVPFAFAAIFCFGLTRWAQRRIAGT